MSGTRCCGAGCVTVDGLIEKYRLRGWSSETSVFGGSYVVVSAVKVVFGTNQKDGGNASRGKGQ